MISNANNQGVGPNIGTDEESFFQSDRDLELLKLRKLKEGTFGTLGLPIQLNSKVLSFKHIKDSFYVAQSGFSCQKIDVKTGEVKKTFTGHNGPVTNCAVEFVNGEEKHLLTSSWDKTIKKWNIETQELLYTCVFHSDFVKTVLIYGDRFYSSSADGLIGIWDLATGKILGSLSGHSRSVEDLVISPCGRYLFSCSSDSTIRKWDLKEMEQILVLEGHLTSVYQLCANWDDEVLWSGIA
jgi:WD40 repeat protein